MEKANGKEKRIKMEKEGRNEIGFLLGYSKGFACSYGPDCVFLFEQEILSNDEIQFKMTKRINLPKSNLNEDSVDTRNKGNTHIQVKLFIEIHLLFP